MSSTPTGDPPGDSTGVHPGDSPGDSLRGSPADRPHDSTGDPPADSTGAGSRAHGLLPAWGSAELPQAPPFTLSNVLRTIGPGIIGLGVAVGSGEWLLGPAVITTYGPTLLWVTTVAVLLQVVLNQEMGRYTLSTGEPIITGYMRTWPGPKFWAPTYGVLGFLQVGWPGWALASATATGALLLGRLPVEADAGTVRVIGYLTFGLCFLIVTVGRKVERTIEWVMWFMMAATFAYLILMDLTTVSAGTWSTIGRGFLSFGSLPAGADWLLLGAFAAYSGLGGISNAFVTNWMRDKGFGMGATVGYIPAATGGRHELRAEGNVFPLDAGSLGRWRAWWKFMHVDQWIVFGVGSISGMALLALLTLEHVPAGTEVGGWAVANLQATALSEGYGRAFWYLTLIFGSWVLFSTQLGNVDGLPRAITDMLWTSKRVRRWTDGDVRRVYYAILAAFATWGCIALNLAQPLTLVIIGANVAAFNFVVVSLHTLVVNRKFLPPELRPPLWREAAVVGCGLFYGAFVVASVVLHLPGS